MSALPPIRAKFWVSRASRVRVRKELLEAIAGLQPVDSGSISYIEDDGTHVELIGKDPLTIQNMGVSLSFVPEDRLGMGLVGNMDLSDNMMLRTFRKGAFVLH